MAALSKFATEGGVSHRGRKRMGKRTAEKGRVSHGGLQRAEEECKGEGFTRGTETRKLKNNGDRI
jgi:hypothetical protein